jgi:hypothetical protein
MDVVYQQAAMNGVDPATIMQPMLHDVKLKVTDEEKDNVYYFKDYIIQMSKAYKSKHLLIMVGSGLNFEKAELYLAQIESLSDSADIKGTRHPSHRKVEA